jgi:hypothetical protein
MSDDVPKKKRRRSSTRPPWHAAWREKSNGGK